MRNKLIIGIIVAVIIGLFIHNNREVSTKKLISYNGNNLKISIDGESSNTLPTSGTYYLADYDCSNVNTNVSWNKDSYKLSVSNSTKEAGVACYLEFSSKPLLSQMEVGSYVKYIGNNGCEGKACEGYNANYVDENNMGNCRGGNFTTKGWRIAYVADGSAYLISAGAPECACSNSSGKVSNVGCSNSTTAKIHISNMDNVALKYCNNNYSKYGICGSLTAWGLDDYDFKKMTGSTFNTCMRSGSYFCGYGNDMISVGSNYWLLVPYSNSSLYNYGIFYDRISGNTASASLYGVRPILFLDSSVVVTGGSGTYDEPYLIDNNYFDVEEDTGYVNASHNFSSIQLSLNAVDDNVTKMCISVDTSVCTNYVDFNNTYSLDLSSKSDSEYLTIYVYYKDNNNKIVSSMYKQIEVDTDVPTNSSATIVNDSDGIIRTLNLASTGANYMCISNTSSNSNDCTNWVDYATTYNWTIAEGTGNKTIYVFFRDEAYNIVGPYTVNTTCTSNCEYKYFMDSYDDNNIFLIRNDGATAQATTYMTGVKWYSEHSFEMNVCGAQNTSDIPYYWCIGSDNNAYYKINHGEDWNKIDTSSYINTSNYNYSIYPAGSSAYIVRSDGKTNVITTSGLGSTAWEYGVSKDMAACSGNSSNRIVCLGKDGYYYYQTSYTFTNNYLGGSIIKLANRTNSNSWIDMYSNNRTTIIESDGTNLYTTRFGYNGASTNWSTSSIPGGGIKTCTSAGQGNNNFCIGSDNYLYYKAYDATSWTKSSLKVS